MEHSEQLNELAAALAKAQGVFWTAVPESTGYFVSECGEILSTVKTKPRLLRGGRCGKYPGIRLRQGDGSGYKSHYIHRLVAESAHGPCPEGQECRHLDGNPFNNDYRNLRWGTRKENHADKHRHGTAGTGENNPRAKLTQAKVAAMRTIRAETCAAYHVIAARFGVSTMTAYRAIERQSWK